MGVPLLLSAPLARRRVGRVVRANAPLGVGRGGVFHTVVRRNSRRHPELPDEFLSVKTMVLACTASLKVAVTVDDTAISVAPLPR